MRNAGSIRDFPNRQAELTNVDARGTFYLAAGACFCAAKRRRGWGQDTTTNIISELSSELAQRFNYSRRPGSPGSEADLQAEIRRDLAAAFESVPASLERMIVLMSGDDRAEAEKGIFAWFLRQLSTIYPPTLTLLSSEAGLLSQIVSAFSTTLLDASVTAE